ncbi:TlpA disulfide reductase family protein [Phocaeicola coprocola]|jgi:Peroxiredoxin|uniref:TlpA disulfide reductase family protein n=1 Tax=Phocaeicola coprocola TaxID=310298 RepID=UPI00294211B2|nr:TlpA disulfide reductase family protein [Phocaeicola coprocola]
MRKILLMATAGLLAFASCQEKAGYTIKGAIEGVAEGDTVYLQNFVDGSLVKMDSAVVKGGAFEFKGTPDSVTVSRYVTYRKNGMRMTAMVFIEKGDITLNMGTEANKVAGTMCNDAYQQFMDKFVAINKEMSEIYQKSKTDTTLTDDQRKDLEKQLAEKDSLGTEIVYNCINENINNLVGVQLLTSYANAFETAKVKALLDKVPAAYSADKDIVALKEHIATIEKTEVGQKFIDFAMNTPEGKEVKLSDFISQNKYTLIDFWASWCGPCRAEMPNVVAAYNAFKAKGFGIVGVSLDNNAEAWKKAIKDLNITWVQMSDLKGWSCEGAKLYGVRAIPATVLVDQEGTIVARNLRGEELAAKLGELLK